MFTKIDELFDGQWRRMEMRIMIQHPRQVTDVGSEPHFCRAFFSKFGGDNYCYGKPSTRWKRNIVDISKLSDLTKITISID